MLRYDTVTPLLKEVLSTLMNEEIFSPFRLVGGTNLSLRFGHRMSDDIDLFTDAEYGSLDFGKYELFLKSNFPYYYSGDKTSIVGFGRSYYIGSSPNNCVKLDLMYTDKFLSPEDIIDNVRMASVDDIVAMKMNAIMRGGRKKDFWDIHKLLNLYSLRQMLELHQRRHVWEHEDVKLLNSLLDFEEADSMADPKCLEGKDWDNIKLDFIDVVSLNI